MANKRVAHFELKRARNKEFRVELIKNGKIIWETSETYKTRSGARKALMILRGATLAPLKDLTVKMLVKPKAKAKKAKTRLMVKPKVKLSGVKVKRFVHSQARQPFKGFDW